MRRRKKAGSKEKLLSYKKYLLIEGEKNKGNWRVFLQNNNPIHVELGTGRGQFITSLAQMNPHINYIGFEIKEEILLKAVEKAEAKALENILFLWNDINKINDIFSQEEIHRIYINFCDPWPKNRWAKRRITHRNFLDKYKNILVKEGEIYFKTDNEKLFEFSLNEFCNRDFHLKNITFNLHDGSSEDIVTTEYEDKFLAMGMKIYSCQAKKRS